VFILESEIALALKKIEWIYFDEYFEDGRFHKEFSNSVASVTCYDRQTIKLMQKVQLWILFTTRSLTVHT
jgi:hypothetical protein